MDERGHHHNVGDKKPFTSLENQFLIAMPGLGDSYFKKSVTLICRHNEDGCFGITVNRPTDINYTDLFEKLGIPIHENHVGNRIALSGGPVQPDQGFVLHDTTRRWENTIHINDDLAVTSSKDILYDIGAGNGPENFHLTLGFSSWESGQLEHELMQNSWLNCNTNNAIIFNTPFERRWQKASDSLGIDINQLGSIAGHA